MYIPSSIDGQEVINEGEEQKIIVEALEENGITVSRTDHKKLKYFTIKLKRRLYLNVPIATVHGLHTWQPS